MPRPGWKSFTLKKSYVETLYVYYLEYLSRQHYDINGEPIGADRFPRFVAKQALNSMEKEFGVLTSPKNIREEDTK